MHASKQKQKELKSLRRRSDFLCVQKEGTKWISKGLIFIARPNDSGEKRIGYVITKKVSKLAVTRNRIRRRLRSVVAEVIPDNAKNGCDYVLIGRSDSLDMPYSDLLRDLKWCLRKTGFSGAE